MSIISTAKRIGKDLIDRILKSGDYDERPQERCPTEAELAGATSTCACGYKSEFSGWGKCCPNPKCRWSSSEVRQVCRIHAQENCVERCCEFDMNRLKSIQGATKCVKQKNTTS